MHLFIRYPYDVCMNAKTSDEVLIDELGGTFSVARLCGVKPPSVTEWKERIPASRLLFLAAMAEKNADIRAAIKKSGICESRTDVPWHVIRAKPSQQARAA